MSEKLAPKAINQHIRFWRWPFRWWRWCLEYLTAISAAWVLAQRIFLKTPSSSRFVRYLLDTFETTCWCDLAILAASSFLRYVSTKKIPWQNAFDMVHICTYVSMAPYLRRLVDEPIYAVVYKHKEINMIICIWNYMLSTRKISLLIRSMFSSHLSFIMKLKVEPG